MGQHVWFLKSKDLYLKEQALYQQLDDFENDLIHLDDFKISQIQSELVIIEHQNATEFHDIFRTSNRNADSFYIDDVIYSKKDCFEWINNEDNKVHFQDKEKCLQQLNKFWGKYPNGVIYFG